MRAEAEAQPDIQELLLPGARLELQFDPAFGPAVRAAAVQWVRTAAEAVAGWLGRFPVPELELLLLPSDHAGIASGTAFFDPAPWVRLRMGLATDGAALRDDWVLVHELLHLALPQLPRHQRWFHEGVATYAESLVRARAGLLAPQALWGGFAAQMPQGQPAAGDQGLDRTDTWGRVYWGGAMFCLLADVQMRRRSQGRQGLRDALAGVLAAGGDYRQAWPLARVLAVADAAVGQRTLTELHAMAAACPMPVDLAALWADLGVQPLPGGGCRLHSAAPLAALRESLTAA
ncbi:MAG: hypothetical protein ACKVQR_10070 [Aquabacterium sp.]